MTQPRYLLVHGVVRDGVPTPAWPGAGLLDGAAAAPEGPWVSWRLLSGNNHELGRAAVTFVDAPACVAAVRALQSRAEDVVPMIAVRGGRWWWAAELDGERVAVAGRSYHRQRECRYNLAHFLAELARAALPAPEVIDLTGRGRRSARDDRGIVGPSGRARLGAPVPPLTRPLRARTGLAR